MSNRCAAFVASLHKHTQAFASVCELPAGPGIGQAKRKLHHKRSQECGKLNDKCGELKSERVRLSGCVCSCSKDEKI